MTASARMQETWLSVQEASAMLGVSPATLRRWSAAGEVEAFTTPGGHRRFAVSTLSALLDRGCGDGPRSVEDEPLPEGLAGGLLTEVVAAFVRFRGVFVDEVADAAVRHGLSSTEAMALVNRCGAAVDTALADFVRTGEAGRGA